ncbi:uroporphyrinogen decarboxylase family protein [Christensenella tenuis]|uniref:Uroporphyrinogen decarboxylase (URO-D) domain-containing protein n=1 Tax=Christensenella tenuis TaxID=2763033 RepID=A0ABR7EC20_9FIRM|nr:uroporphyrinogen decarboxylase family protein [Christensenella tenuis]MBC5647310.1 hypothetical protein [Christensenella tenuis]
MTGKDIVTRAVHFQDVPRTPVAFIDGGAWLVYQKGISYEDIFDMEDYGAGLIREYYELFDSDIVWTAPACYNLAIRALGGKVDFSIKGSCPEVLEPLLKSPEDIKKYDEKKIAEFLLADPGIQAMLEQTRLVAKEFGAEKCIAINYIGPFTLASQLIGITDFMMGLYDEETDIWPLLNFATRVCYEFFHIFLEAGADTVFIGDPSSSGDLISPDMFEQYALPCIKSLTTLLEGEAQIKMLHICGSTQARIKPLRGSGIDGFSLDSIDLKTAMQLADGNFAIFGNMGTVSVMNEKSPDEIYTICLELARAGGLQGGYVMMPGCDLPPITPIENIKAMIRAAHANQK